MRRIRAININCDGSEKYHRPRVEHSHLTLCSSDMKTLICALLFMMALGNNSSGQSETLTNKEIIEMTKVGLSPEILIRKIRTSNSRFDVTSAGLIELKMANVTDSIIETMINRQEVIPANERNEKTPAYSESGSTPNSFLSPPAVASKKETLASARTIALEKSSLQPSRQALEKELMKRTDFKKLNLTITRYKDVADLYVEIGFVHGSLITHRYIYRVYDRRSGAVLVAGETTSWGSLAENLAKQISRSLASI